MRGLVLALLAAAGPACAPHEGSWRTPNGEITVHRVAAPAPANVGSLDSATMSVYATIANAGSTDDTLASVAAPDARIASLHSNMNHGGTMMMMPADPIVIPANGVVRLAPGGTHVMLEGILRRVAPGDTLPVTFVFRRGGSVTVNASVFAYDRLQEALEP